uniref:Putative secreted peptide n=1 Tax=Anopheles braziliensis TaxID=58242 RepID=A0A2M3ZUG7_9DIPT
MAIGLGADVVIMLLTAVEGGNTDENEELGTDAILETVVPEGDGVDADDSRELATDVILAVAVVGAIDAVVLMTASELDVDIEAVVPADAVVALVVDSELEGTLTDPATITGKFVAEANDDNISC